MGDIKNKKYIVSYKAGIKIFITLIILALIIFGIFYLIQNKKDRNFQLSRPRIPKLESSVSSLENKNK